MQNSKKIEISGFSFGRDKHSHESPSPQYFASHDKCNKTLAISSDTISSLFRLRTKDTENTDSFYYRQGSFHSFPYFLISISQNAKSRDELFIRYAI